MKRSGFTLIELIFVIVIIGILSAVAVPKFQNLKQSAVVTNAIAPLADINSSGGASSFLNATELNGIGATDLNITDIYKFQGKDWTISANNKKAIYRSGQTDFNATFTIDGSSTSDDANVTVVFTCDDSSSGTGMRKAIVAKGYKCPTTGETYTIDLSTQN